LDAFIKDVLTIMRKEFTHFFRDPHVIIYSLILPMVGYPLLIVGGFEAALWQESIGEKTKVKVCIQRPPADLALFEAISRSPQFAVKTTADPLEALRHGDIDVVVRPGITPDRIEVVTSGASDRSALLRKRIFAIANEERDRRMAEALKTAGRPPDFLKIFTIKMRNLAPIGEISSYILPAICAFALFMVANGAIYPAVCAFPEEREKRTLDSTLMLPVDRISVVLGKTLAITLAGLLSGAINLFSMLMVFWVFTIQPNVQRLIGSLGGGSFFGSFSLSQVLLILACFVVVAAETASVYLFMAQAARTFKEGQNILTIPLLLMACIPLAICVPGLSLNWTTVMIPMLNIALCLRSAFSSSCDMTLCILALAQNILLSGLLVIWVAKIVGREEFLRGDLSLISVLTGRQWRKQ
jgi:sodium transport system permease protein